jgi:hypothetical protein
VLRPPDKPRSETIIVPSTNSKTFHVELDINAGQPLATGAATSDW